MYNCPRIIGENNTGGPTPGAHPIQHQRNTHVVEVSRNTTAIWALLFLLIAILLAMIGQASTQAMIFKETAQLKRRIESLERMVETEKRKGSELERKKALLETETSILKLNVASLEMRVKEADHTITQLEQKKTLLETEMETLRMTVKSLETKVEEEQRNTAELERNKTIEIKMIKDAQRNTAEFILKLVLETGTMTNVTNLQNFGESLFGNNNLSEATLVVGNNMTGSSSSTEQLYKAALEELANAKEKSDEIEEKPWKPEQVALALPIALFLLGILALVEGDVDAFWFCTLLVCFLFFLYWGAVCVLVRVAEWLEK